MNMLKFFVFLACFALVSGCTAQSRVDNGSITRGDKLPTSYALPGTTTAVVGIGIDKKGIPLETVKEVVLKPGQKVIFAGPDRFLVSFKNKKSPSGKLRYESGNGIITVVIPRDILDKPEYREEFNKKKFVRFDYSIIVNGKELDPPMIIRDDE